MKRDDFMKMIFLMTLALSSTAALADAKVYCKDYNGKIINVLGKDGFDCQSQIYDGSICFTGNVREAAAIINSDAVRELFDGTDGEYVKGARPKGADKIIYTAVDEANEWSNDVTTERCLGRWFRN